MANLPEPVAQVLGAALVAELTTIDPSGRPVTHPLIPLYDGERILFTSSVLFSRKLDHVRKNPKVSVAVSDPIAVPGVPFHRVTIQGDAEVDDRDVHHGWERVMPLWRAKEPAIDKFLAQRFALPLFFERAVISVEPRRALLWRDGRTDRAPETVEVAA